MAALLVGIRIGVGIAALAFTCYKVYQLMKTNSPGINETPSNEWGPNERICSLCLKQFNSFTNAMEIALPCYHKFHKNCISVIFLNEIEGKRLCPVCRTQINEEFLRKSLLNV